MIIRFKFLKTGEAKYLSHLDVLKLVTRAVLRSNISVSYSMGFNPKPRISFSNPIPLGVESLAEYCDILLGGNIDLQEFSETMNSELPSGIRIMEAAKSAKKIPALMSEISHVLFEFRIVHKKNEPFSMKSPDEIEDMIKEYNQTYSSIYDYAVSTGEDNIIFLKIFGYAKIFRDKNNRIFKYNSFFGFLNRFLEEKGLKIGSCRKKEAFFFKDGKLITPLEVL
jgi:radical SAM-linked protein